MALRSAAWSSPGRSASSWLCNSCGYTHVGGHSSCHWCAKAPAPSQRGGGRKRQPASRPKASQSVNAVWSYPTSQWGNWQEARARPRSPATTPTTPTTLTWNQWSAFSDDEVEGSTAWSPAEQDVPDVHMKVAPEGPSDAELRKERHALFVAARDAVAGMPGSEKMVEDYDTQITGMRHAIHRDKPPKEQLRVAVQRKSRAEANRDKAIINAAASSAAYEEAGRVLLVDQERVKATSLICEEATDHYEKMASNAACDDGDSASPTIGKSTSDAQEGMDIPTMSTQQLEDAILAASAAHNQLLAAAAARRGDACMLQVFSIGSPVTPNSGSKAKVRCRSPASTDYDSVVISESPVRSICRTDAYQPDALATMEEAPPASELAVNGYGKASTQVARSATPYGSHAPPTPGGANHDLRAAQPGESTAVNTLFGEALHQGEVRFATEGPL
jgi:hypothetical protein